MNAMYKYTAFIGNYSRLIKKLQANDSIKRKQSFLWLVVTLEEKNRTYIVRG